MFDEFCSGFVYCLMYLVMYLLVLFLRYDYIVFNIRCMLLKVCKLKLNLFRFSNVFLCVNLLLIIVYVYIYVYYSMLNNYGFIVIKY